MAEKLREILLLKIREQEELLARINTERDVVRKQLEKLKRHLQKHTAEYSPNPTTNAEKISLFRDLFRGRADVVPLRWENARTDRTGYAPACANEWVRAVCDKPRVKCGECPNQAFIPVSDQLVLDHLQGRQVIGVYPLLEDESCWFVAADFDKRSWMEDVRAFVDTCRDFGVTPAVERSRSGNGAHVWFFFASALPANIARRTVCYLLTETMSRRHELSMSSYDRLFPNQDTMPRGGFGNLIALPLEHKPRQRGNSVFVDENWIPHADQWAFLSTHARIDPSRIEELAVQASERGRVVGIRAAEWDEDDRRPWIRKSSKQTSQQRITGTLPSDVYAVFAQQVFVDTTHLPSALLNAIKRLAAFQNPEFYKRQALRLSTALTPRVIQCAQEFSSHIGLPRGCFEDLKNLLSANEITLHVDEQRHDGEPVATAFRETLTPNQDEAATRVLSNDNGILVAPPGFGKTVIGAHLIANRARSTLVLVHRTQVLDQWRAQLSVFLGLKPAQIGQIGGGRRKPTGRIDVAMIQSLLHGDAVDEIVARYGHVVVDECHHLPAMSFERVAREVKARYVVGLTATPRRRDGHHPILEMQLGPVRYTMDPKILAAEHQFVHRLVPRQTNFQLQSDSQDLSITEIYRRLTTDSSRNTMILDDIIGALEEGRSPIVLTERRDHLDFFADSLKRAVRCMIVLKGGTSLKKRQQAIEQLDSIPEGEERLILATGRFIGEGFDDGRLDTLLLALPVSWKGTLVQYVGRLHRNHPGKNEVRVYDYVDGQVPVLARMFERRLKGYRAMGYAVDANLATPVSDHLGN